MTRLIRDWRDKRDSNYISHCQREVERVLPINTFLARLVGVCSNCGRQMRKSSRNERAKTRYQILVADAHWRVELVLA